jgi:Protein of unknown function (DUF3352)
MFAKPKPKLLILALGGAGIFIGGSLWVYFLLETFGHSQAKPLLGSNLIPQSALMAVSVSTDPREWQQLRQLGPAPTQSKITAQLKKWQTEFLDSRGVNYTQDIQPWIGPQATLAVMPITAATASEVKAKQPLQIWVLPIANLTLAQAVLTRFGNQTLESRVYKGVPIRQTPPQSPHPYALSLLENNILVITSGPKLMEQSIDTLQGQPALSQLVRYPQSLEQLSADSPFAQVYLNLPTAIAQTSSPSPPPKLTQALDFQGLVANLSFRQQGVQVSSVLWLNPNSSGKLAPLEGNQNLASRLPAETLGLFAVSNFQQLWRNSTQSSNLPYSGLSQQLRKRFNTATQLDFDREFASWMTGEFGLALLPAKGQGLQNAGLVLIAQTKDRSKAEPALAKLDRVLRDRWQWSISETKTEKGPLITWKIPPNLPVAQRGWLDDQTAFLALGSTLPPLFQPQPSLVSLPLYQQVFQSSSGARGSQFFLDLPRTFTQLAGNPIFPKPGPSLRRTTEGIAGMGITANSPTDWSSRYDLRLEFTASR